MSRLSDNLRGAILMMGAMAGFTFNDALIKLIGAELPLFQIIVLRGLFTSCLIYLLARYLGALRWDLPRRDWGLITLRILGEVAATFFFLTALLRMPLANVTAVLQVLPLTVTLGSALFFREPVGWRRLLAILIGFAGMMIVLRPGPEGFAAGALSALAAVGFVTLRDLVTRRMSKDVPSLTVTLCSALGVTASATLASTTIDWQPVALREAGLLVLASGFILAGYLCSVMVMRVGEISFIAPFRYTSLLWALLLGLVIFGEWPDAVTLLGAAIVVGTGLFTLYREARQG